MTVSIGKFVQQLALDNADMPNVDILAKVKEQYPQAKTTMACIAWYKSDMRKKGLIKARKALTKEGLTQEIQVLQARLAELTSKLAEFDKVPTEPTEPVNDVENELEVNETDEPVTVLEIEPATISELTAEPVAKRRKQKAEA